MKPRRPDAGFAMLMVFVMAACVAIMLYLEMPRVAFEAERQRELLLIDRGNQFKRAIQVFVLDKTNQTHRYPASVDELESFNNHRFLRRKYIDPMTGKDEWRLVHINGGVLTDSVTTQNKDQKDSGSTGSNYINVLQSFDAPSGQSGGGVSAAQRRRPSENAGAPGSLDPGMQTAGGSQGTTGDSGAGGGTGGVGGVGGSGQPGGSAGTAGASGGGATGATGATGAPAQNCNSYIGGCTPVATPPGTGRGLLPGQPGAPANSPTGVPGQNTGGQDVAAGMINRLLTSPRPGGPPTSNPGTTIGGGLAGVASKFEAEGIMVINDRTAINEWEFWWDRTKYRTPINPIGGAPGTPIGNGPGGNPPPPRGGGGGN